MGEYTGLDLCWKQIGADFKANVNINDSRFFKYFEKRNFDYNILKNFKKRRKNQ